MLTWACCFVTMLEIRLISCLVAQPLNIVPRALVVCFTNRLRFFYSTQFALCRVIHELDDCLYSAEIQQKSKDDELMDWKSLWKSVRFHCKVRTWSQIFKFGHRFGNAGKTKVSALSCNDKIKTLGRNIAFCNTVVRAISGSCTNGYEWCTEANWLPSRWPISFHFVSSDQSARFANTFPFKNQVVRRPVVRGYHNITTEQKSLQLNRLISFTAGKTLNLM